MKFTVEFSTSNAAFQDNFDENLRVASQILEATLALLDQGETKVFLKDSNGNTIGSVDLIPEPALKTEEPAKPLCDKCKVGMASQESPCPYAEDVHQNKELCNCCDSCRQECLDGI